MTDGVPCECFAVTYRGDEMGAPSMSVLMLKCPTTGREFSTGIYVDEDSFKRLLTVTKAVYPHCRQLHGWWTKEARLFVTGEQRPPAA
jgi:hypothetical protein